MCTKVWKNKDCIWENKIKVGSLYKLLAYVSTVLYMHRDLFAYKESSPYINLSFWDCSPHFVGVVFKIIFPSACFSVGDLEGYFPWWAIPQNSLFKKIMLFLLFLWLKKAVHKGQDFYPPVFLKRTLKKNK